MGGLSIALCTSFEFLRNFRFLSNDTANDTAREALKHAALPASPTSCAHCLYAPLCQNICSTYFTKVHPLYLMMYHIMLKQQSLNPVSEISFLDKGPQEALEFHNVNVSVVQSSLTNVKICAWEDQFNNHMRYYLR